MILTTQQPPRQSEAGKYYHRATEEKKPRGPMVEVKGNRDGAILVSANYVGIWRKAYLMQWEEDTVEQRWNPAGEPRRAYMRLFDVFFNSERYQRKLGAYRRLNIRYMQAIRRANFNAENEPLKSFKAQNGIR